MHRIAHISSHEVSICIYIATSGHQRILKDDINLTIDNSYSRSNNSHEIFKNTWGWSWGYRNKDLRNQFNSSFPKYIDKIQDKLFNMNVKDGPKRIEDFE